MENDSPTDGGTPDAPPQPLVNAVPMQNVSGEAVSVTPVPGQTLVTMATATVTANNGQTVTIPGYVRKAELILGSFSGIIICIWDGMMIRDKRLGKGVEGKGGKLPARGICINNIFFGFFLKQTLGIANENGGTIALPSPVNVGGKRKL